MILGLASFDGALHWDGGTADIDPAGAARRRAAPRWIETDAFFQFHFANGFEEDGAIVLDLTRYPDFARSAMRCATTGAPTGRRTAWRRWCGCAIDLATGAVESHASPPAMPTNSRASIRATSRPAIATPTSPTIRPSRQRPAAAHHARRPRKRRGRLARFRAARLSGRTGVHSGAAADGEEDDGYVVTLVFDAPTTGPRSSASTRVTWRHAAVRRTAEAPRPFSLHGTFTPR